MKASVVCSPASLGNRLFDPDARDGVNNRTILLKTYLEELGVDLATYDINPIEQSEFVIHFDAHASILSKYLHVRTKRLLLVNESPIIDADNQSEATRSHFDRILTWESNKIDNEKTFWLGCGCQAYLDSTIASKDNHTSRRDVCVISGNKYSKAQNQLYSARDEAISYFAQSSLRFDMFGQGWDRRVFQGMLRPFNRIPLAKRIFHTPPIPYRGAVTSKFATLKNYRFSICFENVCSTRGYISEKIFDSMFSGCVPIYWGADDICDFVPAGTFIDMRNFDSYYDLELYLKNMTWTTYSSFVEAILGYYPTYLKSSFHEKVWAESITNHCYELINRKTIHG